MTKTQCPGQERCVRHDGFSGPENGNRCRLGERHAPRKSVPKSHPLISSVTTPPSGGPQFHRSEDHRALVQIRRAAVGGSSPFKRARCLCRSEPPTGSIASSQGRWPPEMCQPGRTGSSDQGRDQNSGQAGWPTTSVPSSSPEWTRLNRPRPPGRPTRLPHPGRSAPKPASGSCCPRSAR